MVGRHVKDILKILPSARVIDLPQNWFDNLDLRRSAFSSLYGWLVEVHGMDKDSPQGSPLRDRTFVGKSAMRRLLTHERERIKKECRIQGEALDRALWWQDFGSGPLTDFAEKELIGNVVLVIREQDEAYANARCALLEMDANKERKAFIKSACGANFYEYLLCFVGFSLGIGDLAQDILSDPNFPRGNLDGYYEMRRYMERQHACHDAIERLGEAWGYYIAKYPNRAVEPFILDECEDCLEIIPLCECEDGPRIQKEATTSPTKFIYFIEAIGLDRIKIGFSNFPERRLSQLATGAPTQLKMLLSIPGTLQDEKALHRKFAHLRLNGEWFRATDELRAHINKLTSS